MEEGQQIPPRPRISRQLSDETIAAIRLAYLQDFGEMLTREETERKVLDFIPLLEILMRPVPRDAYLRWTCEYGLDPEFLKWESGEQ